MRNPTCCWPLSSVECECRRPVALGKLGPSRAIGWNRVSCCSGTRSGLPGVSVSLDDCNIKLPRLNLMGQHVTLRHVFLLDMPITAVLQLDSYSCPLF